MSKDENLGSGFAEKLNAGRRRIVQGVAAALIGAVPGSAIPQASGFGAPAKPTAPAPAPAPAPATDPAEALRQRIEDNAARTNQGKPPLPPAGAAGAPDRGSPFGAQRIAPPTLPGANNPYSYLKNPPEGTRPTDIVDVTKGPAWGTSKHDVALRELAEAAYGNLQKFEATSSERANKYDKTPVPGFAAGGNHEKIAMFFGGKHPTAGAVPEEQKARLLGTLIAYVRDQSAKIASETPPNPNAPQYFSPVTAVRSILRVCRDSLRYEGNTRNHAEELVLKFDYQPNPGASKETSTGYGNVVDYFARTAKGSAGRTLEEVDNKYIVNALLEGSGYRGEKVAGRLVMLDEGLKVASKMGIGRS